MLVGSKFSYCSVLIILPKVKRPFFLTTLSLVSEIDCLIINNVSEFNFKNSNGFRKTFADLSHC